jgi:hypothetical protein
VRSLALLSALIAACGASPGGPSAGATSHVTGDVRYTVRIDEPLERMEVTVCFERPPRALFCGRRAAAHAVRQVELRVAGERPRPLGRDGAEIPLPRDTPRGACVVYTLDVDDAMSTSWMGGTRRDGAVLVGAAGWLWRPSPMPDDLRGTLVLDLPDGVAGALPFAREGDGYLVEPSVFRYLAHTAFGRFVRFDVDVPGGELDVVRLPGPIAASDEELARWLAGTGQMVATLHGRFPAERAMVVLVPAGGGEGIAFGNAGRGGGASVMLIVEAGSTFEVLASDWVPPHEMSHLALPFVQRSDAWLSEGTATYYQEVLRARGGALTALEAWRNLDEGFASGRRDGTGRTLEGESEAMFATAAFRRVYWAGTALALLADVELRKRGTSLDEAIARLDACCAEPPRTWEGLEVARALDRVSEARVYEELAERHLPSRAFPDVEATFQWLGLARNADGDLDLATDAPGIAVRDAIMRAP